MSDLNIEEQEFKDKELEAIEEKSTTPSDGDQIFTSPEPETEVLDGRGMIYEILDSELE